MQNHIENNIHNHQINENSDIQRTFEGATVFITGATGFLGRVLVEKLLRTCNGIEKLYLMIRSTKKKTSKERFEKYFDNALYDLLKAERPKFLGKVSYMEGDCELPELGLTDNNRNIISSEVNFIFHVAASVRFTEPIKRAAYLNINGIKEIVKLAKLVSNLKCIVHVSTAYSFCVNKKIDETFYKPRMKAEDLFQIVDSLDDEQLLKMTPALLAEWPNTYTFTKALAEDYIHRMASELPVAIIRPSIILGIAREPIVGWVHNAQGALRMITGTMLGVIRAGYHDDDKIVDLIPVDFVANVIIASAWDMVTRTQTIPINGTSTNNIQIYNCVSGNQNSATWGEIVGHIKSHSNTLPSVHMHWHVFMNSTPKRNLYFFLHFLLHIIPAFIVDSICKLTGRKPILLKIYRDLEDLAVILSYFGTNEWHFQDKTTQALWNKMGKRDKELFDFDITQINWDSLVYDYVHGIRFFLLRESLDTLPTAKRKLSVINTISQSLVFLAFCLFIGFLVLCLNLCVTY